MDIAKLFELQKYDVTMERLRRRLGQIQLATGETPELEAARSAVRASEAEFHRWHAAQKDAELETKDLDERIRVAEADLMGGTIRSGKDLQALEANIASLRRQRGTVEENGVQALLQVEAVTQQLQTEQATLVQTEAVWKSGQAELLQEETKLRRNYAQFKQQREAAAQGLDRTALDYYESVRTRKNGIAVAPVQNNQCGVCHILVPTGVISAVRSRREEAVLCPSCGRILFVG